MHDRDLIQEIEGSGRISVKLPYDEYKSGVFWFAAKKMNPDSKWYVEGHYEGTSFKVATDGDDKKPVELAVNICTYKREPYVIRNMKSLMSWTTKTDIDGNRLEVGMHMHVFIVDNARSLLTNEEFLAATNGKLSDDYHNLIEVIPNDNTGGTGGFSRGMVAVIDKRRELGLTHLLMMDDDAVFDPELFVRLYGFLCFLKEEYREITVGGALMREDYPYIQHAAGEWYSQFKVNNDHLMADMRNFEVCTSDWMTGTVDEDKVYGAWWCCCYNMSAITRENLPLPIFVHHDDIQFGLKQQKAGRPIVFLNGVCVWHQGFETVFPGVKQYYNMRNTLITEVLYEPEFLRKKLKWWAIRRYIGMLISYRYGDCEFVYRGLMDFLKGRSWLMCSDPEALHKELMATYKGICPFVENSDIDGEASGLSKSLTPKQLREYYDHGKFEASIFRKLTFNGWFLHADKALKIITPLDSPWATYKHKNVLLYEPSSGKGCIVKRSNLEFFKGIVRIIRMSFAIDMWRLGGSKW